MANNKETVSITSAQQDGVLRMKMTLTMVRHTSVRRDDWFQRSLLKKDGYMMAVSLHFHPGVTLSDRLTFDQSFVFSSI
jgi:hypothetical protein